MLKRKRAPQIIIAVCAAFGAGLGVLLGQRAGEAPHTKGLSWAAAVFAVLTLGVLIASFLCIKKDRKQFGAPGFTGHIRTLKRLKLAFYLFVILTAAVGGLCIASCDLLLIPVFLLFAAVALMYGIRNSLVNAINDNGIFYWGVFHAWDSVMRYKIEEIHQLTVLVLEIKIWTRGLDFDFDLGLAVNPYEKDEIESLIREKLAARQKGRNT